MKINERGFWENKTAEGHEHDEGLAKAIVEYLHSLEAKSVVDFGCGDGFYTKYLNANGICCLGFDGNPNTPALTDGQGYVLDLTQRHNFGPLEWVLSLEVGEHIPQEYEKVFLDNLHNHNTEGMVISWAIRGQGGDGHVNCLDNWEVARRLLPMGYMIDEDAQVILRNSCAKYPENGWWFRNTVMVFRRIKEGTL